MCMRRLVPLSASAQRLQRLRDAEARQLQAAAAAGVENPALFIPLSKDAEQVSGSLFKVALVMISLPMAGWFISKTLLVALCINGLRSHDPAIVRMSLSRVRTFIFSNYLATKFEEDDGVVLLVSLLGHANQLEDEAQAQAHTHSLTPSL
ncbi:hypothetical protein FOA52_015665 [Chlamydomonas sp. UWO 241]|nr:hypothetical protein FOA52_015665 [Chlamydomonas sp. UWO 241]